MLGPAGTLGRPGREQHLEHPHEVVGMGGLGDVAQKSLIERGSELGPIRTWIGPADPRVHGEFGPLARPPSRARLHHPYPRRVIRRKSPRRSATSSSVPARTTPRTDQHPELATTTAAAGTQPGLDACRALTTDEVATVLGQDPGEGERHRPPQSIDPENPPGSQFSECSWPADDPWPCSGCSRRASASRRSTTWRPCRSPNRTLWPTHASSPPGVKVWRSRRWLEATPTWWRRPR